MRVLIFLFVVLSFQSIAYGIDTKEVNQFVKNWYKGFDNHKPLTFFTSKFTKNFSVKFPGREEIINHTQFKTWYDEVNPLEDVKHEILSIQTLENNENYSKIKVRVDWSARNGDKKLSFPALQVWELIKIKAEIRIKTYNVEQAK